MAEKEGGSSKDAKQPIKRARGQRHCRRCGKTSYNTRTYTAEIVDPDDSDASE
jgi:type II secretory ATPase GspE/PulE/Tfp pilus assembly ATPase PilB-like protein